MIPFATKRMIRGTSGVLGVDVSLEVDDDAIRLVGRWRRRAVDRASARIGLGTWVLPNVWATIGVVLVIEGRGGAILVGVRDRTLPMDERTSPSRTSVDVIVSGEDFDALRRELAPSSEPAEEPTHPRRSTVFELRPNAATGLGSLRVMLPWFQTILVLMIVGPLGGMTIGDSAVGSVVLTLVTLVIIAVGLVRTFGATSTPPPASRLEVGAGRVALFDPEGTIVFDVGRASLEITRGVYVLSGRGGTFRVPTVEIRLPDREKIRIGVWDERFDVSGPKLRAPRYLIAASEWREFLCAIGR